MKLYLQNIVDQMDFNTLPFEWTLLDFRTFSKHKTLFDYQELALKRAVKALWKYYVDCKGSKEVFYNFLKNNGLDDTNNLLDLKLEKNKLIRIYEDFAEDFIIDNDKIRFSSLVNRMSFWMATGSGKTLIIVKLIEILANLIKFGSIPNNNILFLTYRQDLIEQFQKHVNEFNNFSYDLLIEPVNLKDYETIKKENSIEVRQSIKVFYYRSDLISDTQKDKIIDFRTYDNNGKWYIILDEAHKGDKEDSKRQHYYNLMSRNGFLFNFSATFNDPIDLATCVSNFNLEQFVSNGYGKHIYIFKKNISEFDSYNSFNETAKRKVILKTLLLTTLIKKQKQKYKNYYHNPLILTLVNTVNTEESDMLLFFKELEKVATQKGDESLLDEVKKELLQELDGNFEFENDKINLTSFEEEIKQTTYKDILESVFNSSNPGTIEVIYIPQNKQELILKLKTASKAFGLIKIGDITEWIKNKLQNYEIIDKIDNESVFANLNSEESEINILIGSRAFYEGWDSNRPNVILFINIGKTKEAKKFVIQSIGRGVRIEPISNKRKRLQFLLNDKEINLIPSQQMQNSVKLLETLFVFSTKADNLITIIETLKEQAQNDSFDIQFSDKQNINSQRINNSKQYSDNYNSIIISEQELMLIKKYYDFLGDKVFLTKFNCSPKLLQRLNAILPKTKIDFSNLNFDISKNKLDRLVIVMLQSLVNNTVD